MVPSALSADRKQGDVLCLRSREGFKKRKTGRENQERAGAEWSWRGGRLWQQIEKPELVPWRGHSILVFLRNTISFLMVMENGL